MTEPKLMSRPAVDAILDYLADEVGYASFARDLRAHIDAMEGLLPRRWTIDNCPDHHYRAMGMCPYCGDTLEAARARNVTGYVPGETSHV